MPKLTKKYLTDHFLSSSGGDLFAVNAPPNPYTGVGSISLRIMTVAQKATATTRLRQDFGSIIKYINSIEDWCLGLKSISTIYNYLSHSWELPFTSWGSFKYYYEETDSSGNLEYPEFHQLVDLVYNTRQHKQCFGDTMERFIEGEKNKYIQWEFSAGNKVETLYDWAKQYDFEFGFKLDGTTTVMVVNSPQTKAKFLKMTYEKIGFNFPILTYAEYLALKNARWYAYKEMCLQADGSYDRSKFNYMKFIKGLFAHSNPDLGSEFGSPTYWNIDPKIAKDIMMAFGFDFNGNMISVGSPLDWIGSIHDYSQFPYTNAMSVSLMRWWDRFDNDAYQLEMERKYNEWFGS